MYLTKADLLLAGSFKPGKEKCANKQISWDHMVYSRRVIMLRRYFISFLEKKS